MASLTMLIEALAARAHSAREDGSVAIEYGLLATLIAVAIIAALTGVGGRLITAFGNVVF